MSFLTIPHGLVSDLRAVGINPIDIVLYINSSCNLRCKHCYVGNQLLNISNIYEGSSVVRFIDALNSLERITVLGGEPLLHPAILEILRRVGAHEGAERRITTNLTWLSDDVANTLVAEGIRASVSVDGASAQVHDAVRGSGAFAGTIRNIRKLVGRGGDCEITHTVNKLNLAGVWDMLELSRALGVRSLNLHKISPRGNALSYPELLISPTEWRDLVDALQGIGRPKSQRTLRVRYELGFVSSDEYEELLSTGRYAHHPYRSYYSKSQGNRIVVYPDRRIYISSEAFGTESFIGEFDDNGFVYNTSARNEIALAKRGSFTTSLIDPDIVGDERYPIPLSVSYRRQIYI